MKNKVNSMLINVVGGVNRIYFIYLCCLFININGSFRNEYGIFKRHNIHFGEKELDYKIKITLN